MTGTNVLWALTTALLGASVVLAGEANLSAREVGGKDLKTFMAGFYKPVEVKVDAKAAQYKLPLDLDRVTNAGAIKGQLQASAGLDALVKKQGFGAGAPGWYDGIVQFYKSMETAGTPIFVTSDSLLHLYHVQFDETLKGIEEREFFRDALALSVGLQKASLALSDRLAGEEKEAARRCAAFFSVPVQLLYENTAGGRTAPAVAVPASVAKEVDAELALIRAHAGFAESSLFHYNEDYSQYVPRGHYTRSENLKKYFKALMWYGRLTFVIKGKRPGSADVALVSVDEARVQTKAAVMLASLLGTTKLDDGRGAADVWARMYEVTAYYVGLADDLTPNEYTGAMRAAFGANFSTADLGDKDKWFKFRTQLAAMRPPEIYSGTGDLEGPPAAVATEDDLATALDATKGLRLMGQRYIPDSFMMGRLVYPTVGAYGGKGAPFTLVQSEGGPIRGFPRGLDVLAVLGSDRARAILKAEGDDEYARYDETLAKLRAQFGALSQADWHRNLYWSWLYALKALLDRPGAGYPTFMQTEAWQDKQINAALGSWAQLRHDTILYGKQSYTMMALEGAGMPSKMVEGYVEPVPEFYARLLALTGMTIRGLDEMKVLDRGAKERLAALQGIIERLLKLSVAELKNEKLTGDDYAFIRSFGDSLQDVVAGVSTDGLQTTIVADVHTDGNTRQCLEEGTGRLRPLFVAYPMPDGGVVVGCGPAFSYYEFKHPMADRLTDEKWKEMIRAEKAPELSGWTKSFGVAGKAKPQVLPGRMSGPPVRVPPGALRKS